MHLFDKERSEPDKNDLYARLGLSNRASDEDIEKAHKALVNYLKDSPDSVREWAQSEIAEADDAYERLSSFEDATTIRGGLFANRVANRAVVTIVTLVVVVVAVVAVYRLGDGTSGGKNERASKDAEAAQSQDLTPGDRAKVEQLMEKVKANPKDVKSRIKLGDLFFKVGDYASAGNWMDEAVKLDPQNVTALLALGAAQFNLNGIADAQRQWLRVVEIDPKNVEAYYDLGFLYLSKKPPDKASARAAWKKVVELAPKSSVAKTVSDHIKSLKVSPEPTSSASGK